MAIEADPWWVQLGPSLIGSVVTLAVAFGIYRLTKNHERQNEAWRRRGEAYISLTTLVQWVMSEVEALPPTVGDYGYRVERPELTTLERSRIRAEVMVWGSQSVRDSLNEMLAKCEQAIKWDWHGQDAELNASLDGTPYGGSYAASTGVRVEEIRIEMRALDTAIQQRVQSELGSDQVLEPASLHGRFKRLSAGVRDRLHRGTASPWPPPSTGGLR